MTFNVAIWRPRTINEITRMKHVAGLFGAGVVEVYDLDQLQALVARHGGLVSLEVSPVAKALGDFLHPDDALYLVGPQNGSIPDEALTFGQVVEVERPTNYPYQPDAALAVVLHHRHVNLGVRA